MHGSGIGGRMTRARRVRRGLWVALCVGIGLALAGLHAAHADAPTEPAKPATAAEKAQRFAEHVRTGLALFKQERWDDALAHYWAAYDINPVPLLLFNAAQAQRRAQRWGEALSLYERFLSLDPASPVAPEAEAHAATMRANRDRDRLTGELRTASEVATVRAKEATQLAEVNEGLRDKVNQMLVAGQLKGKRPLPKRAILLGTIGGGAAALAIAIGLGVGLQPTLPSAELGAHPLNF